MNTRPLLVTTALVVAAGIETPATEVARRCGVSIIELSVAPGASAGQFDLSREQGFPVNFQKGLVASHARGASARKNDGVEIVRRRGLLGLSDLNRKA